MTDDDPAVTVPETGRELRSTLDQDTTVTLALHEYPVRAPGADEVVVRVEASPVNPSDMGLLFAMGDLDQATATEVGGLPAVQVPVSSGAAAGQAARVGRAMAAGNEGGGTVVAAGGSEHAQAMLGRVVGFQSGDAYAEYRTVPVAQCLEMASDVDAEAAAAAFVNPLTAQGMVETMRREGHTALVHTVGASNLGQMLQRICRAEDIGLVNIVRKPEQVEMLRGNGAEHVCDSSAESFTDDLTEALRATDATIAFDAIGGGDLAGTILSRMEAVASEQADEFSRYGSNTMKQVYIYGGLDRGPTVLRRDFGLTWAVGGWLLTPFLASLDPERATELRQRVADEITTTFASSYGMRLTLDEVVDPDQVRRYGRMATGEKALITPEHQR